MADGGVFFFFVCVVVVVRKVLFLTHALHCTSPVSIMKDWQFLWLLTQMEEVTIVPS